MSYQQLYDSLYYAILALGNAIMTALTVNALTLCTSKQKKMTRAETDMKNQPRAIAGSPKTSEEAVKLKGKRTHGDSVSKISVSGSLEKPSAQFKPGSKEASKEKIEEDSFDKIQPRIAVAKRYSKIANLHVAGRRKDYETLEGMMTDEFADSAR